MFYGSKYLLVTDCALGSEVVWVGDCGTKRDEKESLYLRHKISKGTKYTLEPRWEITRNQISLGPGEVSNSNTCRVTQDKEGHKMVTEDQVRKLKVRDPSKEGNSH